MKNIKFLFLLIGGLSTIGCSKLGEEPVGLLAPESFFTSLGDIQTAVNGAYGHMEHRFFMSREMSMSLMLRSDMVDLNPNVTNAERVQFNDVSLLADNANISSYWPKAYQIIGAANQAIAGAELVNADEAAKNKIVAQAYFARAFVYFHLVRQFGAIPYLDAPVTDIQAASTISKTSADEVYANIIADLMFAKQWLPNTQVSRAIPAKSAASSFLADVYLTMGDYQMAYSEAKEVISNEATYNLGLESDFQNLFDVTKIDASKEPLFVIDFIGQSNGDQGRDYQGAFTGIRADDQYGYGGGWSVSVPSLGVYNAWNGQDYRKSVSLDTTGVFKGKIEPYTKFTDFFSAGDNRPHIAKYTRKAGPAAEGNGRTTKSNYIMMRYAEVLLIAAEALNEISPGSAEAAGYVNRVRARARAGAAGGTPSSFPADVSGLSQDVFRVTILEDRKWELAFEFKRWYDIARRKLGDGANGVFSASGLEGAKPNFQSNRDYLFPLPANELVRNPNLLPQNSGY
ncbi:RagB/SusD family nutrient uptake outer membrane protein [Arcticibacterium luteifluviistationis]|uniref:RagB/SusD family nutrient uptake outer membrane protein n=1 Tax=Arcticibacterium luteifluviistationis TaxID=1784714 RepID=A0A2Z4G6J3_9BACT|nr:RagB/SusD family nutrient uptake outer membrane protein [Arcticibacterium luteifluviistationis]AWV96759.1 RagB/SusD family nutrient uptake outer membrane protein [Arcticibacterium luteifluviistationis]